MAIYFFDTDDGDELMVDEEGLQFPSREAARIEALSALRDMARDYLPDGDLRTFVVSVRAADGRAIYAATLSLSGGWAL